MTEPAKRKSAASAKAPKKKPAKKSATTSGKKPAEGRSTLETAVLAVAIAAIVALVSGLVIAGVRPVPEQPDLRVSVGARLSSSGGDAYIIGVRNVGGRTAENVVIEVTAGSETREAQIPAIAREDEETATVVFPAGTAGPVTAHVQSYSEPAR